MQNAETGTPNHILKTPIWMVIIRGAQVLLSLVILAMAGKMVSDVAMDETSLALAIALLTWIVVGYIVLTEKISALHAAYHILAVIILDGLWMILWLATFAAVAARRSQFVFDRRRSLEARYITLYPLGGALMSAIAGLGALVWLTFIATFTWEMVMFFRGRKEGRFMIEGESKGDNFHMESKPLQHQPVTGGPVPVGHQQQPTEYASPYGQQQQQQAAYNQMTPSASYAPTPQPQDQYAQQQQQQQQQPYAQQPYSQQPYAQQGYYPQQPQPTGGYNSELAGSEGYGQHPYTSTQSPPPQQPYTHTPPPQQ